MPDSICHHKQVAAVFQRLTTFLTTPLDFYQPPKPPRLMQNRWVFGGFYMDF
jgi:hypothetical protein